MHHPFSRRAVLALLLSLSLASLGAHGQTQYALEDEADKVPWKEADIQLPPAPVPGELLKLDIGSAATQEFTIDPKSISIGPDGVVRYTLVATSRGGAVSISYEGIRCESFERRVYAFGHKDGTWTRSRRIDWARIVRGARNDPGETLALDFFCQSNKQVGTVPEIVERIRYKRVRNPRIAY
jgi:hypothetical protein